MASIIDCGCSKMLNRGLSHAFFLSLFKLVPCPIYWIVCVLAYSNFIFEFKSSFSTARKRPLCLDTYKYKFHFNCLEHSICISLCTACISCKNILIRSSCQHEDFKITLLLGFCMWMKNFLFLSNLSSTYSECQFYLAQFSNVLISSIGLMPSTHPPGTLVKL